MDERINVPMNRFACLEFAGLVFDTCFILEDKLANSEDGCRMTQDKMDKYF